MSTLKDIHQEKLTSSEVKSILVKILGHEISDTPLEITIKANGEEKTFEVISTNTKKQRTAKKYELKEISYSKLQLIRETGVYISIDDISNDSDDLSYYYGLFINVAQERDLRYFSSKEACLKWLRKKLRILNK